MQDFYLVQALLLLTGLHGALNKFILTQCHFVVLSLLRVSSDEDISTDEDDSVEANGSLEGFIDPSHSQHLQSGSVDMMAIYRWVYCS